MKILTTSLYGKNASSSQQEAELPSSVPVGALVLGIMKMVLVNYGAGYSFYVQDVSGDFASEVTESASNPGAPVVVQNQGNHFGSYGPLLIAMLQDGTTLQVSGNVELDGNVDFRG